MIVEPRDVTCVRCGATSRQNTQHRRTPHTEGRDEGLDGRTREDADPSLQECPHCGWLDVSIDTRYPDLAGHEAFRRMLDEQGDHVELARSYMVLARLRGAKDPGVAGCWLRRAAWADDDGGREVGAQVLRLRAGRLFEGLLAQGHALVPWRGGSSLLLTDLFRIGGDVERAALHLRRGMPAANQNATKRLFAFEAWCLSEGERRPHTVGEALDAMASDESRIDVAKRFYATTPPAPPIVILPCVDPPLLGRLEAKSTFTVDFLRDEEALLTFLRRGLPVWPAIEARPALLDALCRAVDHPESDVRERALAAFDAETLPREAVTDAGVEALLVRLEDDTFRTVRDAGSVLGQIVARDTCHHGRVRAVVERVLPRWKHDPPTEGNLERILFAIRPPALIPPEPGCRAPRSYRELAFGASLDPCPTCGDRPHGFGRIFTFDAYEDRAVWRASWPCPCGEKRTIEASVAGANDLSALSRGRLDELDGGASLWIAPRRFADELARLRPHVRPPDDLPPIEWRVRQQATRDARVVAAELHKLVIAHDLRGEGLEHAALEVEIARLDAILERFGADSPRNAKLEPHPHAYGEAERRCAGVRGLRSELRDLVERGLSHCDAARLAEPWLPKAISVTRDPGGALVVELGTDVAWMSFRDAPTGNGADVVIEVVRGTLARARLAFDQELTLAASELGAPRHVACVEKLGRRVDIEISTRPPHGDDAAVTRVTMRIHERAAP